MHVKCSGKYLEIQEYLSDHCVHKQHLNQWSQQEDCHVKDFVKRQENAALKIFTHKTVVRTTAFINDTVVPTSFAQNPSAVKQFKNILFTWCSNLWKLWVKLEFYKTNNFLTLWQALPVSELLSEVSCCSQQTQCHVWFFSPSNLAEQWKALGCRVTLAVQLCQWRIIIFLKETKMAKSSWEIWSFIIKCIVVTLKNQATWVHITVCCTH